MNAEKDAAPNGSDTTAEGAVTAAQPDLGTLLKEFDKATIGKTTGHVDSLVKKLEPVINFASTRMAAEAADEAKNTVEAAITFMREPDELKGLPKRLVRGFLHDWASENPDFAEAFERSKKDPKAWKRHLAEAREAFREEATGLAKPQAEEAKTNGRDDAAAAAAAVKGASAKPPEKQELSAADLWNMSPVEWERHKRKLLAEASA